MVLLPFGRHAATPFASPTPHSSCPGAQVWLGYSGVTLYYLWACTFHKLDRSLPRQVRLQRGGPAGLPHPQPLHRFSGAQAAEPQRDG